MDILERSFVITAMTGLLVMTAAMGWLAYL